MQPTYKGEVMLLRWADSSTGGRTVTFTLEDTPDDPERHPFKGLPCGKDGQRFALVVVPIAPNEHPNFKQPEPEKPERPKVPFRELTRKQQAGILCADERFRGWLGCLSEADAVDEVRSLCGVQSRRDLDMGVASAKWDDLVSRYRQATGQMAEIRS